MFYCIYCFSRSREETLIGWVKCCIILKPLISPHGKKLLLSFLMPNQAVTEESQSGTRKDEDDEMWKRYCDEDRILYSWSRTLPHTSTSPATQTTLQYLFSASPAVQHPLVNCIVSFYGYIKALIACG